MMTIFEKAVTGLVYNSRPDSHARVFAVTRGTVLSREPVDVEGDSHSYSVIKETIEVAAVSAASVECPTGSFSQNYSENLVVVMDREIPAPPLLKDVESSQELDVLNDEKCAKLEKASKKATLVVWAWCVTFGVLTLSCIALHLMIGWLFFVLLFVVGGFLSVRADRKFVLAAQSKEDLQNAKERMREIEGSRSYRSQLYDSQLRAGKEVWIVPTYEGSIIVSLLKNHNKNNAMATLIKTKLDLLPSVFELNSWLWAVDGILELDQDFPVDIIPVHTKEADKVLTALRAQKKRSTETKKKLEKHRAGVLEKFARDDSDRNVQLALEHIKYMED